MPSQDSFSPTWRKIAGHVWIMVAVGLVLLAVSRINYLENAHRTEQARAAFHAALIREAATALMVLDDRGRIIEWNPEAERLLGWSREAVLGSSLDFLMPDELLKRRHAEMFPGEPNPGLLAGRVLRVSCWVNRRDQAPIQVSVDLREIDLGGSVVYTAQFTPDEQIETATRARPTEDKIGVEPSPAADFDERKSLETMLRADARSRP